MYVCHFRGMTGMTELKDAMMRGTEPVYRKTLRRRLFTEIVRLWMPLIRSFADLYRVALIRHDIVRD